MSKKVLMLTSVASMIDQFNIPNIELLKSMGYDVHVACNFLEGNTCTDIQIKQLKEKLNNLTIKYHQIDFKRNVFKLADNIKAYRQVHKLMLDNEYRFVHCQSPIGGVCGRLAAKATNTKVIYTAHGFHFYKGAPKKNWIVYYGIEKWLSRYTDVLITINKEDYLISKKMNASKIEYIPGVGIDVNHYSSQSIRKKSIRQELNIGIDDPIILSVGELNQNKNHETIIKAISMMGKSNVHYIVCGQGDLKDHLIQLAIQKNMKNRVHLIGFRSDIDKIYHEVDVFAFPSYREGLSVALMEALSSGLPIVCSKIRGNVDLILDNKNGFLLDPNDAKGFSKSIEKFLSNPELCNDIRKNNLESAYNYDKSVVRDKMREIYNL